MVTSNGYRIGCAVSWRLRYIVWRLQCHIKWQSLAEHMVDIPFLMWLVNILAEFHLYPLFGEYNIYVKVIHCLAGCNI